MTMWKQSKSRQTRQDQLKDGSDRTTERETTIADRDYENERSVASSDNSTVYSVQLSEAMRSSRTDFRRSSHSNDKKARAHGEYTPTAPRSFRFGPDSTPIRNSNRKSDKRNEDVLAKKETNAVLQSKVLVVFILVACTVSVSTGVYIYVRNSEQYAFESNFYSDAEKTLVSIGTHFDLTLGAVDSFVVNEVSLARTTNQTWPFVTIPDYSVKISKIRSLSHAFVSGQYQLVTGDQRKKWENYSVTHDQWVKEGLQIQKWDTSYRGTTIEGDFIVYPTIHNNFGDSEGDGPFLPQWQSYPVVPIWPPYNWDGIHDPALVNALPQLLQKRAVISDVGNLVPKHLVNDTSAVDNAAYVTDWAAFYISEEDGDPSEPLSDIFYPIIDTAADYVNGGFNELHHGSNATTTSGNVVGIFYMSFYWRMLLRELLPSGSDGIILVVWNEERNQSFTYQINGPTPIYLGPCDMHDPSFDDMEVSAKVLDLAGIRSLESETGAYTGLPLSNQTGVYSLSLYPSVVMERDYKSSNPIIFCVVAVCIFAFTSLVFLLYDGTVERRQKKLMKTAIQSTAIVSSMFPKTVRDRLFQSRDSEHSNYAASTSHERPTSRNETTVRGKLMATKHRLRSYFKTSSHPTLTDDIDNMEDSQAIESPFRLSNHGNNVGMARVSQTGSDVSSNENNHRGLNSRPIADLFPEATVMFADIAGFTAWASTREPSHVFTLLETLYGAFDAIATRRGVFKVETIGDSYVAACGLPEPQADHAIVITKFARDCRHQMTELTKQLETMLGPDTGELELRFGLHSGPVTAGVLRGRNARFQLFGDTVNTASRMESTGVRNRIHVSQATADKLIEGGRAHWITPREEKVEAKGKGTMQTYWVEPRNSRHTHGPERLSSIGTGSVVTTSENSTTTKKRASIKAPVRRQSKLLYSWSSNQDKLNRLIDWNVDILARLLCELISSRNAAGGCFWMKTSSPRITRCNSMTHQVSDVSSTHFMDSSNPLTNSFDASEGGGTKSLLDEVKEVIEMPEFDPNKTKNNDGKMTSLPPGVYAQLHDFVETIASLYRSTNPFHNFDHASHVGMSVVKLLTRIVTPDKIMFQRREGGSGTMGSGSGSTSQSVASSLHDFTYGITSDPLTQFACVFAALIHDVDHPGVPNSQLVVEQTPMATKYKNKSVAEQNSIDVAWKLLFGPAFGELQRAICPTQHDLVRFRQLVVNSVMATDVLDADLKALRNARWDKAFSCSSATTSIAASYSTSKSAEPQPQEQRPPSSCDQAEDARHRSNRKATIVIEHLIQASDVAHTMQHWHVYRKWNERLFVEMYHAYQQGRSTSNPADFWYEGEMKFFDFYVLPLAKKLSDCGVFGVSSDEYLNYAQRNREEWETRGKEVVQEIMEKLQQSQQRQQEGQQRQEQQQQSVR